MIHPPKVITRALPALALTAVVGGLTGTPTAQAALPTTTPTTTNSSIANLPGDTSSIDGSRRVIWCY